MVSLFLRRVRKKVFKRWARNAFFPAWRLTLLRWTGVRIGHDVYIADDFLIVEELSGNDQVIIGDRVSIAPRVTVVTSSHPNNSRIRPFAPVTHGGVTIGPDAWIGSGAIVLPGVTIGRGAVIGAQSVVAADVPPLNVVAGQPARTIRVLTPPPDWS
jgi:acetyltransferase-like isoleucine patch superfamily enzyme